MAGARTVPSLLSSSRCPFCHAGVTPTQSVACQVCLARHHSACWAEAAACASCGSRQALRPPRGEVDEALLRELLADAGYDARAIDAYFAESSAEPLQARCRERPNGRLCNRPAQHAVYREWLCATHAEAHKRQEGHATGVTGVVCLVLALGIPAVVGVEDPAVFVFAALFLGVAILASAYGWWLRRQARHLRGLSEAEDPR